MGADCWGDLRMFSSTWNHMADITLSGSRQRSEPIQALMMHGTRTGESGNMRVYGAVATRSDYTREEVQRIFDWALAHHASRLI